MPAPAPAFQFGSSVNFRLGLQPPNDIDPDIKEAIGPLYTAFQQVFFTFINNCGIDIRDPADWASIAAQTPTATLLAGNLNRLYVVASETIQFGAMINLFLNAGVLNARNANSGTGIQADGFCSTTGGLVAGQAGEVQLATGVANITGLTIGGRYYLNATAGHIQLGPDVTAGHIEQYIGIAITTSLLFVNMSPAPIQH